MSEGWTIGSRQGDHSEGRLAELTGPPEGTDGQTGGGRDWLGRSEQWLARELGNCSLGAPDPQPPGLSRSLTSCQSPSSRVTRSPAACAARAIGRRQPLPRGAELCAPAGSRLLLPARLVLPPAAAERPRPGAAGHGRPPPAGARAPRSRDGAGGEGGKPKGGRAEKRRGRSRLRSHFTLPLPASQGPYPSLRPLAKLPLNPAPRQTPHHILGPAEQLRGPGRPRSVPGGHADCLPREGESPLNIRSPRLCCSGTCHCRSQLPLDGSV